MTLEWTSMSQLRHGIRGVLGKDREDNLAVLNRTALRYQLIDRLVYTAVLSRDAGLREGCRWLIREAARVMGIFPASIYELYKAMGQGRCGGFTVPAINARGLPYDEARALFRVAHRLEAWPFVLEIARSEIGYLQQPPAEYAAAVLGAAILEGFQGPVFLQGDHFQVNRASFQQQPQAEREALHSLIAEAVEAGFFNIDIDASTLVDFSRPSLEAQQEPNFTVTAELTGVIRRRQPPGITISVGAEIGEIGRQNSTVEDLDAFMTGYRRCIEGQNISPGISKISIQTGTKHGGVVLPDGTIARVQLDFDTLQQLSQVARERYSMAGAVQHGASTLPDELFHRFRELGTAEIHLATGFQNAIYDSPHFPPELRDEIYAYLRQTYGSSKSPEETDAQFLYRERKQAFGPFKEKLWHMPEARRQRIGQELEAKFTFIFTQLGMGHTREAVRKYIKPVAVPIPMPAALKEVWQGVEA